jgi:hypothetical protein
MTDDAAGFLRDGPSRARRTVELGHSSDRPSSINLAEISVSNTESPFAASLNRLCNKIDPNSNFVISYIAAVDTDCELNDFAKNLSAFRGTPSQAQSKQQLAAQVAPD